jgi:hypothetical protein
MKRKWTIRIGLSILLLLSGGGLYFYVAIWQPHRQFYRDEAWWKTATTEQQRLLCHRIISHRIGAPHDAFLHLQEIGNKDSVPLLIRALRWQDPKGESMVCTTSHCIGALCSLTGEDYGTDCRKWENWWRATGMALSPTNFQKRAANKASEATSEAAPSAASEVASRLTFGEKERK